MIRQQNVYIVIPATIENLEIMHVHAYSHILMPDRKNAKVFSIIVLNLLNYFNQSVIHLASNVQNSMIELSVQNVTLVNIESNQLEKIIPVNSLNAFVKMAILKTHNHNYVKVSFNFRNNFKIFMFYRMSF
jgi:hypothetical protein